VVNAPTHVTLPQLGETVSEGTVTRWLKRVGDSVMAGEALVEIATDKVETEIPAPVSGVLLEVLVAEDVTVPVGTVLAVVAQSGGEPQAG
jgi:pyruvate dehydrogenase E2 component (dihydrolipoamide acetyltransferase)